MQPDEAKSLVFKHWYYLNGLAKKRFSHDSQMAEQAIDYMLTQLERDNWRRVCEYQGQGFTAFITVVANHLLTDFARKIGEMPYIPIWINERGHFWKKIYLLLLKNLSRQEVIEMLQNEAEIEGYQRDYIEEIINTILKKEKIKPSHYPLSLNIDEFPEPAAESLTPIEQLDELESQWLLETIFQVLQNAPVEMETEKGTASMKQWLQVLQNKIKLNDEETLLLRMIYRDGLTISEAGRRLKLNPNQVAGRHRRLLARIQGVFKQTGIYQELQFLLDA